MPNKRRKLNPFIDSEAYADEESDLDSGIDSDEELQHEEHASGQAHVSRRAPQTATDRFLEELARKYGDTNHARNAPSPIPRQNDTPISSQPDLEIVANTWVRISNTLYDSDIGIVETIFDDGDDVRLYVIPRLDYLPRTKRTAKGKGIRPRPAPFDATAAAVHLSGFLSKTDDGHELTFPNQQTRIFHGPFELLTRSSIHLRRATPTHEEFTIFLSNNCPPLVDLHHVRSLARSTALALVPGIRLHDRCIVVRGPWVGYIGEVLELFDDGKMATMLVHQPQEGKDEKIHVPLPFTTRHFEVGDSVQIAVGQSKGSIGWVTRIEGTRVWVMDNSTASEQMTDSAFLIFHSFDVVLAGPNTLGSNAAIPETPCCKVISGRYKGQEGQILGLDPTMQTYTVLLATSKAPVNVPSSHLDKPPADTSKGDDLCLYEETHNFEAAMNKFFRGWRAMVCGKHLLKGHHVVVKEVRPLEDYAVVEVNSQTLTSKGISKVPFENLVAWCKGHLCWHYLSTFCPDFTALKDRHSDNKASYSLSASMATTPRQPQRPPVQPFATSPLQPSTPRPLPDDQCLTPAWNPSSHHPRPSHEHDFDPPSVWDPAPLHTPSSIGRSLTPILDSPLSPETSGTFSETGQLTASPLDPSLASLENAPITSPSDRSACVYAPMVYYPILSAVTLQPVASQPVINQAPPVNGTSDTSNEDKRHWLQRLPKIPTEWMLVQIPIELEPTGTRNIWRFQEFVDDESVKLRLGNRDLSYGQGQKSVIVPVETVTALHPRPDLSIFEVVVINPKLEHFGTKYKFHGFVSGFVNVGPATGRNKKHRYIFPPLSVVAVGPLG